MGDRGSTGLTSRELFLWAETATLVQLNERWTAQRGQTFLRNNTLF